MGMPGANYFACLERAFHKRVQPGKGFDGGERERGVFAGSGVEGGQPDPAQPVANR
jgi:hypothetical protein